MLRSFRFGLLMLALAAGLSGCGVRGPLEAPPGEAADEQAVDEAGKPVKAPKAHKPFILDSIL